MGCRKLVRGAEPARPAERIVDITLITDKTVACNGRIEALFVEESRSVGFAQDRESETELRQDSVFTRERV
jgi:hypothetical protein